MSSPRKEEDNKGQGEGVPDMTEYCRKLESWLCKCYTQRALATSAYFTALNTCYGATSPPPGPHQSVPLANGGGFNNNNNYFFAQQQQQQGQGPQPAGQPDQPAGQPQQAAAGGGGGDQPQPQQQQQQPGFPGVGRNGQVPQFIVAGVVVKVAPIWKRLLAECIDFLFLLVVKLFITFTIIDSFDLIDLDSIDLESLRNEAAGSEANLQGLYDIAFSLTSELILLELTHRIVVCFFEAYCLSKAGSTPGKTLLGLRVIQADDVLPYLPPPRNINNNNNFNQQIQQFLWDANSQTVIVRPGCFLTFPRAFLRSVLKNFSLAVFFPLCFTLFHFDYSRTLYDLMAKSIVIEI